MPASRPPAPPSRWPVMDLVELTASRLGVVAEHALHGNGLDGVAQRRGGAVRVDVSDLFAAATPRVAQRRAHDAVGAVAVSAGCVMWCASPDIP